MAEGCFPWALDGRRRNSFNIGLGEEVSQDPAWRPCICTEPWSSVELFFGTLEGGRAYYMDPGWRKVVYPGA